MDASPKCARSGLKDDTTITGLGLLPVLVACVACCHNPERNSVVWQEAPERLVDAIRRAHGGLKDDTSIIVLDLLPPGRSWPSIAGRKTASRQSVACLCFSPCAPAAPTPCTCDTVLGFRF